MIDAFKPEYLQYAPYLKSLTEKYQHGELDMGIGHWSGVDILFNGKSENIAVFCKTDGKSSLHYLKYFSWLKHFGGFGRFCINVLVNLPRWFKGYELFKTGNIPIDKLHTFEICVKRHAAKNENVHFQYFGELDNLGHAVGTKDNKIKMAVREIDADLSKMDFDILFSDHGMVDVNKIVSVPRTNNCFIDSDIARYWGTPAEIKAIKDKLPFKDGKIIHANKKFGDLVFLAKTGVLFFPNFWSRKPVKGMHGYDGKHKDMKAFYIIKKEGSAKNLKAEDLHKLYKQLIDERLKTE